MRTLSRIFLFVLAVLFAEHLVGTPLYAQEPLQSETDEQAEFDGKEAGGEADYAVAQRSGTESLPLMYRRSEDAVSYPREAFVSDFFRPPADHAS